MSSNPSASLQAGFLRLDPTVEGTGTDSRDGGRFIHLDHRDMLGAGGTPGQNRTLALPDDQDSFGFNDDLGPGSVFHRSSPCRGWRHH